jgi:hypothetical protein
VKGVQNEIVASKGLVTKLVTDINSVQSVANNMTIKEAAPSNN